MSERPAPATTGRPRPEVTAAHSVRALAADTSWEELRDVRPARLTAQRPAAA
ncbi:hypothetical protein ACFXD5_02745 [Streptomyces sp. NPDC059385]|uniref:hypothetical protein n=1 Tax=Streptomyces sp. NPDC059385 TaxID=3346817 RepID=UPI0036AA0AD6